MRHPWTSMASSHNRTRTTMTTTTVMKTKMTTKIMITTMKMVPDRRLFPLRYRFGGQGVVHAGVDVVAQQGGPLRVQVHPVQEVEDVEEAAGVVAVQCCSNSLEEAKTTRKG